METAETTEKPARKTRATRRGRKTGKEIDKPLDLQKVVSLRLHNKLTYEQIANQFGVSKQCIHQKLKPLLKMMNNPEATQAYRENRAEFLDNVERELTSHLLDPSKLKAASVNNLAYAVSQLNNIGRLERGQSTSNVQVIAGLSDSDRSWLADMASQFLQRQLEQSTDEGNSGD